MASPQKRRPRLLAADTYIRDAGMVDLSEATRLHCSYCAIYLALLDVALEDRLATKTPRLPNTSLLTGAFDAIQASDHDKLLTLKLETWLNAYDTKSAAPCSVADAVALAERINLQARAHLGAR